MREAELSTGKVMPGISPDAPNPIGLKRRCRESRAGGKERGRERVFKQFLLSDVMDYMKRLGCKMNSLDH